VSREAYDPVGDDGLLQPPEVPAWWLGLGAGVAIAITGLLVVLTARRWVR